MENSDKLISKLGTMVGSAPNEVTSENITLETTDLHADSSVTIETNTSVTEQP
jgi:hypothetical protein